MSIDISEEAGVRFLHFGSSWIQGAMRIARPFALELDYTREMMTPLLLHDEDWPRKVLQIGLGAAGGIGKTIHLYTPHIGRCAQQCNHRIQYLIPFGFDFGLVNVKIHTVFLLYAVTAFRFNRSGF